MGKRTTVGEVVNDYLGRFPNTPALTLAKKIFKENQPLFSSVEHARERIRHYSGKAGESSRKYAKEKVEMPETFAEPERITPYVLPKASRRILFLSDIHCPYHDVPALELALNFGIENLADTVVLLGDFMDFYRISRFEPDPRKRKLKDEIESGRQLLGYIRSKLPDALIIFKEGNHDERWEAYLKNKAPELLDMEEFRLDVILHFAKHNIIHVGSKRLIKAGKNNCLHGHEYKQGIISPVNIARNYLLKTKDNIVVAHHHTSSEFVQRSVNGDMTAGRSLGCLCDLSPEYMPYNGWNLGFGWQVTHDSKGTFTFENKKIYNGNLY